MSIFVLCTLGLWPQRMELCGSGTFLQSMALQDFLLQIRTLTSLICLSLGACLWQDTDYLESLLAFIPELCTADT